MYKIFASRNDLFVRFTNTGKPAKSQTTTIQDGITMTVEYLDEVGAPLDLAKINQSQDIISKITIKNNLNLGSNIRNLALTQTIPSGWEIINDRMTDVGTKYNSSKYSYQDIRDDRIYTYFDLNNNDTKFFYTRMTATYQGNYYLPNQSCRAMYNEAIQAVIPGKMINVKKQKL